MKRRGVVVGVVFVQVWVWLGRVGEGFGWGRNDLWVVFDLTFELLKVGELMEERSRLVLLLRRRRRRRVEKVVVKVMGIVWILSKESLLRPRRGRRNLREQGRGRVISPCRRVEGRVSCEGRLGL